MTYVWYVEDTTINEDMLFYKHTKRRATAKEIFKIVDDFKKGESIKLSGCVGVCMDTAWVMAGNKGLQVLIKQSA
jgi:hypothetical protein